MFIDRVKITIKAGKGGGGCVAFRREKHIPRGGPSGGNGGRGGDVILKVDPNMATLLDFYYTHTFKAENGKNGEGSDKTGASGGDRIIAVPPGTSVLDLETRELLADLIEGDFVIAKGGRGGWGNAHFKTSANQAPRKSYPGNPGDEKEVVLELKMIADIGIVGVPNAGKSTLLSRISKARPKVAAYPFTTLEPMLGIVEIDRERRFTACDIPGIVEDAHIGKGLGLEFLRHVERTAFLFLLVDLSVDPAVDLATLEHELDVYADGVLSKKPRIIVGTKLDIADRTENWLDILGDDAFLISSVTGEGLKELLEFAYIRFKEIRVVQ